MLINSLSGPVLKSWAKLQHPVALSSGEAAYIAMSLGAVEGRAMQTLVGELGEEAHLELLTDSSAAKGSAERMGTLKMKHLQLREFYLKELMAQKVLEIVKISTKANPANLFTKVLGAEELRRELVMVKQWRNEPLSHQVTYADAT